MKSNGNSRFSRLALRALRRGVVVSTVFFITGVALGTCVDTNCVDSCTLISIIVNDMGAGAYQTYSLNFAYRGCNSIVGVQANPDTYKTGTQTQYVNGTAAHNCTMVTDPAPGTGSGGTVSYTNNNYSIPTACGGTAGG